MRSIVFFLEEPSAKEMLTGVLPRILPENVQIKYIVFQGKQHLEKSLKNKLRGWNTPNSAFVVMCDKDSGDCKAIKAKLVNLCREAGRDDVLVRIACRELESFYLGDLTAVEKGLGINGLKRQQQNRKFRNPDGLNNAAEELFKLTNNMYGKIAGSRTISPHLNLETNHSKSFNALITGITNLINSLE
jgi:hypothetical protein